MTEIERQQLAAQIQSFLMNPESPETIKVKLRREIAVYTQSLDCTNLSVIETYLLQFQTKNRLENNQKTIVNKGKAS